MTNLRKLYLEDGSWCWELEVDGNIRWVSDEFLEKLMNHTEIKELPETEVDNTPTLC